MQMFLSTHLFAFFNLVANANPIPLTLPLNSTAISNSSATAQSLYSDPLPIPDSFSIKAGAFGPDLEPTTCLFNAVSAFGELALFDYDGLSDSVVFHFSNHPSVIIAVVTPGPGIFVERRFALWGIWLGIRYMMAHHQFQAATFALSWEDVIVGAVDFARQSTIDGGNGNGNCTYQTCQTGTLLPSHPHTVNPSPTVLNATTPSPVNADNLKVTIGLFGHPINLSTIILLLFVTLHDAAQHSATDIIPRPYRIGLHTALFLITPTPRAEAPFPEYDWLIRSLVQLPDFMLNKGKFSEASIVVRMNGAVIIDVSLINAGSGPSSLNTLDGATA
ncbi:MAG: hypothetical protein ALECFALPRED_005291 [Alectoria fallacina]|uniref:Uncharacterized protein n=1 Tax=Alectoria fallacina TaxID=1903189 RepID=A0A8H3IT52_9LECA|nr:MAG: hypothetical protein ALECFALPRED_005291 [Alectoria fallacina]